MSLNLNEKIVFLNGLVDDTLTIDHYAGWELGSYMVDSLFSVDGSIGHVRAENFADCIDRALELVRRKISNG